jgi:hypothetical protein
MLGLARVGGWMLELHSPLFPPELSIVGLHRLRRVRSTDQLTETLCLPSIRSIARRSWAKGSFMSG